MPKKIESYSKERKEILNKLFEILEITEFNKSFSLHNMDNNPEKQQLIIDLEPDIKKYFICSRWTCMHTKNVQRKWLSIVKYIFKDMEITINSLRNVKIGTVYNLEI
jgi:hypothetical protein